MTTRPPISILALPAFRRRSLNPYQALLYERLQRQGVEVADWTFARAGWRALWRRVDLWHLHYPDTVLFPRRRWQSFGETLVFALLLTLAKARGIKILWTVHDLGSHDELHPRLEAWFWRYFIPRLDGIICLGESGRRLAGETFPGLGRLPAWIVPHGHYLDAYPHDMTRPEARRRLDLPEDAVVLLTFGMIRPYKAVPDLIRTFLGLADERAVLVVAGRAYDPDLEREIRAAARERSRVRLDLRWIPFEEAQVFFAAADLVVLAYRRILNSGTLMLSLGFGRPVLAPDKGALREQQTRFGADWVRLYEGELDARALAGAVEWAQEKRGRPDFSGLDWDTLARETRRVYEELTRTERR